MQRRQFIALLGGAATWPLAARAQQDQRVRRLGVLSALAEDDPESVARRPAFEQALKVLNWTNGNNLRIDYRWAASDTERIRKLAAEIIALEPDVILTSGSLVLPLMMQATTAPSQSCLCRSSTRSGRASSKAWRGPAATSPALPHLNTASLENGWSCSSRSRLT
jgi:putative ABC transport system substrate-binding protein